MYRFTVAVAEMLFQSDESNLYLLPALPSKKWRDGLVAGLRGKGAVTVGFRWIGGKLKKSLYRCAHTDLLIVYSRLECACL